MLLTITSTTAPATDLGYLLHKNPARRQDFELPFGRASVFYPEASEERCTAALMIGIDPVALSRARKGVSSGGPLQPYVNSRPYVASSFMSVAISRVLKTALNGRCDPRPELALARLPLTATLAAVPSGGGADLLRRLFEPLGYQVDAQTVLLDDHFPEWGESPIHTLRLTGSVRLSELLTHLYVLIPVLDGQKHYWVGDAEVEKLLHHGEGWLSTHPEKELIARRYLKQRRTLARLALEQLLVDEESSQDQEPSEPFPAGIEESVGLNMQRVTAVVAQLARREAASVVDLGCGDGKLLSALLGDRRFSRILGMDVSVRSLEIAAGRLHLDRMPPMQRDRIDLIQGSLTYRDDRIAGFDSAVLSEVIEHLDEERLVALERTVFEVGLARTIIVTTPNVEFNTLYGLGSGERRHRDHRFEWTRDQFQDWAGGVAARRGYVVAFESVGPVDDLHGSPTQMAVFSR